jgi:hypothetical protein
MMSRFNALVRLLPLCLLFCVAFSSAAFAQTTHDRTQFGHDINIEPGEQVGDATCFGCSIRVRGHVATDVTVFGGSVTIEDQGQVEGDATVFGGGVRLEKNVKVGGDITVFGGQVRRDPAASVGGDVTNFSGGFWIFLVFVLPLVILAAFVTLVVWIIQRLLRPAAPVPA